MDFDAHEIATYYRERAPKVPQRGKDWRGPCPVHNGDGDNFSVDPETGMAYCFTQCGRGWDILGLEQDLTGSNFPEAKLAVFRLVGRPDPPQREAEIDEAYDYTDADGNLAFQSIRRYRGRRKSFVLRRPDGRGGWSWNMDGVQRVPYRLPNVIASDTVLIPEGERDVHTCERLGYVASCNSEGSGKFGLEHARWFADKVCILLPDNDAAGRDHARKTATLLSGIAREIRILELPGLPEKGDVTDWYRMGGRREQITPLIAAAPEWTPAFQFAAERLADQYVRTLAQFIETDCKGSVEEFWSNAHSLGLPTPWEKLTDLMAGGLRQSDVYVIGANQGAGKTSLALQFAIQNVKQNHGVLLFSMEMNHRQVFQRMVGIEAQVDLERFMWLRRQGVIYSSAVKDELTAMVERINEHTAALYNSSLFVNTKTGVTPDYLLKECQRLKSQNPIELVIVDHMQLMASTGTVRGDYEKFTAISRATKEVAMQLNVPVILISQTSRNNSHDKRNELDVSDLRGSGAIEEDASVVLLVYHDAEDRELAMQQDRSIGTKRFSKGPLRTWLKIGKNRWGEAGVYVSLIHNKACTRFDLPEDVCH